MAVFVHRNDTLGLFVMRHSFGFHLLLFGHIIGAMTVVAGVIFAGGVLVRARRAETALEVAVYLSLAPLAVVMVVAGSVIVGVCGFWLVVVGGFGFGSGWVIAAILLYVAVLGLGALGGKAPKRARLAARELGSDPITPELRLLLWDRRSRWYNDVALALMVVLVWLMVFKS
ncbi:MAG: DUF2269 family protein [Actinobacteria bacterium]|nr:DUF2269 family protein [Actinomycetota bacterium]